MKINEVKGIIKGKRALHAVLICQGIKGLGDNPEQILLIHAHEAPFRREAGLLRINHPLYEHLCKSI